MENMRNVVKIVQKKPKICGFTDSDLKGKISTENCKKNRFALTPKSENVKEEDIKNIFIS